MKIKTFYKLTASKNGGSIILYFIDLYVKDDVASMLRHRGFAVENDRTGYGICRTASDAIELAETFCK